MTASVLRDDQRLITALVMSDLRCLRYAEFARALGVPEEMGYLRTPAASAG